MGVWSGFYAYPKKKSYKQLWMHVCVCFLIGDLPHLSLSVTLITYTAAHQVSNRCCLTLQLLPNSIILPFVFRSHCQHASQWKANWASSHLPPVKVKKEEESRIQMRGLVRCAGVAASQQGLSLMLLIFRASDSVIHFSSAVQQTVRWEQEQSLGMCVHRVRTLGYSHSRTHLSNSLHVSAEDGRGWG